MERGLGNVAGLSLGGIADVRLKAGLFRAIADAGKPGLIGLGTFDR